jgi:hypothetical protein
MGSGEEITFKTWSSISYAPCCNSNEVLQTFGGTYYSVIGLVSIPGMMTGAILGGASIPQAVRYQQIIMFLISANTTLAVTMSVLICLVVCLDGNHRLRPDRVTGGKPWMWRIRDNIAYAIWKGCRLAWRRITCRAHIEEHEEHVENGGNRH